MGFFERSAALTQPNQSNSGLQHLAPNYHVLGRMRHPLRKSSVRALDNPGNSRDDALTIKNFPYDNEARIGSDEKGSDFYKIKQDKDKKIKFNIYVENDEGIFGPSLTFALQNKNGKTLASDKVSGNDDDEIEKKLGKGTYYIKVSTDGESVPYDIEVTKG